MVSQREKERRNEKRQSEKGRQTSHGELHANESETICKRAFISPGVKPDGEDTKKKKDERSSDIRFEVFVYSESMTVIRNNSFWKNIIFLGCLDIFGVEDVKDQEVKSLYQI